MMIYIIKEPQHAPRLTPHVPKPHRK